MRTLYFALWFLLSSSFSSPNLSRRLAGNAGPKKSSKIRHLGTITQLCWAIYLCNYGTYRQLEKNVLSSNISARCPHNMVNFGPLAAEIGSVVWGTPANFNGFRVLAALLHGTPAVSVRQTLRHWREGATYIRQGGHHVGHRPTFQLHLYSTRRQSRGTSVPHIVLIYFCTMFL